MPSENAIGRRLKKSEIAAKGLGTTRDEGPDGTGKFYMKEFTSSTSTVVANWYEFDLVNATRSRGFWQPKVGVNYNATENFNIFANFAHVERFVDLSVYYNQGRVNPEAGDEKSNQYEVGVGWASKNLNAKLNAYSMTWDNKSSRIQDQSKAGEPGYDRNGFRTILVGTSSNKGVEFEFNSRLDGWFPIKGFELRGSATISDNKWTDILPSVTRDPSTGARQVFNSNGKTATGARDTVYMDELKGTHVGGPPQTIFSFGLTYRKGNFFVGIDGIHYARQWGLDGETYIPVDGQWNSAKTTFTYVYSQKLPSRTVFDAQAGYRFNFSGIRGDLSIQAVNIFNTEYLADVDNFGVQPGVLRSWRYNLRIGL